MKKLSPKYSYKDTEEILGFINRDPVRKRLGRDGTIEELVEEWTIRKMELQFPTNSDVKLLSR